MHNGTWWYLLRAVSGTFPESGGWGGWGVIHTPTSIQASSINHSSINHQSNINQASSIKQSSIINQSSINYQASIIHQAPSINHQSPMLCACRRVDDQLELAHSVRACCAGRRHEGGGAGGRTRGAGDGPYPISWGCCRRMSSLHLLSFYAPVPSAYSSFFSDYVDSGIGSVGQLGERMLG
jgi:hypothetical protein